METQDIKNMGLAYLQVLEAMKKKKIDPVDADELKGDHDDRDDKDIDNDGDADKSDEYLHNRRKAVKAAITKEEVKMDEAKKMTLSAKQIKTALASAKAQAKPKDQVSLKKAPFDIPKESFDVDSLLAIFEKLEESQINFILDNLDEQQLDEISNKTIDSYRKKAYGQYKTSADKRGDSVYFGSAKPETRAKHAARYAKRHKGIGSADKRTMARDPDNFKFGRVGRDGHDPKNDSMSSKTVDDMRKIKGYSNKKESWTILNRIQEKAIAPRDMNHVKGATPPEAMDSKASPKAKEFAATSGVPASVTLDANVVAQQTADAIRASAAKISGNSNRSNDQKTGDKNIIKSTMAESKGLTKLKAFLKLNK